MAKELSDVLKKAHKDLKHYEALCTELRAVIKFLSKELGDPQPGRRRGRGLRENTQTWFAHQVLKEAGKPLATNTIVEEILARGYETTQENKQLVNAVYTGLKRRDDIFRKVGSGLWDLSERTK